MGPTNDGGGHAGLLLRCYSGFPPNSDGVNRDGQERSIAFNKFWFIEIDPSLRVVAFP
jgi:hypothetical protein